MDHKTSRFVRGLLFSATLWPIATACMAQQCQVVISHPEIQLGAQRYSSNLEMLFGRQTLMVTAECLGDGPMKVLIDGTPDAEGQQFRFGATGSMVLSLLSAQYDGVDTALRLASAQQGERQISSRQPVMLPPGSQLTTLMAGNPGQQRHLLTLQLRLDFPVTGGESRIRDLTELDGQVRFEVQSYSL